ncbi:MAG: hypothetical protein EAX86_10130 [Candidatus Heimdallarchaeota archaeon]|nr:hypothetical protein [Candidatus Heimdallarchaeota archaeon]
MFSKRKLFGIIALILIMKLEFIDLTVINAESEDWGVNLFDSESFIITKAYDAQRFDNSHVNIRFQMINGLFIDILVSEDSTFTLMIADFIDNQIHSLLEFENLKIMVVNGFVHQTIQNQTYWKTFYEEDDHVLVTRDLILIKIEQEYGFYTHLYIEEWNWKTGWLERYYTKSMYNQTLMYELEINKINEEPLISTNMIYGWLILIVIMLPLFFSHRNTIKRKIKPKRIST